MKKVIRQLLVFVLVVCLLVPLCTPAFAEPGDAIELGTYGNEALTYFSVAPENVICISQNGDSDEIKSALKAAEEAAASTGETFMVYVPAGTHPIYAQLKVQPGVILCGETDTIFDSQLPEDSPATILVWVYGSVYGGTYNCNQTCDTVLRIGDVAFANPNGYVMYTTVNDAKLRGITASGENTSGVHILYNTVTNVGKDCIGVSYGAVAEEISGNVLSNAEQSGIDIIHTDVINITENTISNVAGHGISTDTEQAGRDHAYCNITNVTDNTITDCGHHGVYLEKDCKITGNMSGNVITNSTLNGVCLGENATIGSDADEKYFFDNTVQESGRSNISVGTTGSVLYMGADNRIINGKNAGIAVGEGACLYIIGENNYITDNAMNGIQIASGGWVKTFTQYTYINNNRWGVNMNEGGTALLNYCVIEGNSLGSVYYVYGSTYSQTDCTMGGRVYVAVGTGESTEPAEPVELGTNAKKALSYFSIDPDNIIYVSENGDSNEIKQCLSAAEKSAAAAGQPYMVYVPAGTHPIYTQLKVQPGVILCGEKNTIFDSQLPADSPATILVWVYGSVYGGTFNCNKTCDTVLRIGDVAFAKPNGYVMYTTVTGAKQRGIAASGSNTSGCYISYNTVKDVGKDCVGVCNGATAKGVIGNTLSNAVQSGIDIVHANVVTISKNTISNVTGHGISTDTEQTGRTQNYCRITTVTDNTITNCEHHGVYLEKDCKITGNMSGNVITNCTLNGVCLGENATIGSSTNEKYFYNNTVQESGRSNISVGTTGSILYMGADNKIINGKNAGIAVGEGARLYIIGKNNSITDNAMNGIQIASGGWVKTFAKTTYINNNRWGVNMNEGGTALLNYCVINGNSLGSVYYVYGSTYRQTDCTMGGRVYVAVGTGESVESAKPVELGTYGKKALSYFSIGSNNIIYVSASGDSNEIKQCLSAAEKSAASAGKPYMVYVPAGKHPIYTQIKVPKGVILCGEKNTIFDSRVPADSPAAILVWVYGSVYGGTFNCNKTCDTVLRFGDCAFAKPNGFVMYTIVTGAKQRGITASGSKTSGCYISYNTVRDVGKDCVGVCNGATAKGVIGNTLSNAVQSGIDIVHANVVTISKNTISNVTGHGISTDTEQKGRTQNYCRITTVTDNKITGAKHHGVYLEKNCKITGHMSGNVISNCTENGVCIGGKGGNASIGSDKNKKYFYNNTVQGSGKSNVSIANTGSALYMGSGNKITKGKGAGIAIGKGGRVYILGKNNYITYNKLNGIQISAGGWMKSFVKYTYINNNRWGVNMNAGGTALLNYCVIKGNSLGSVYYVKGSTYRRSGCIMDGKIYCKK